jgi:hypothetical protein
VDFLLLHSAGRNYRESACVWGWGLVVAVWQRPRRSGMVADCRSSPGRGDFFIAHMACVCVCMWYYILYTTWYMGLRCAMCYYITYIYK